MCPSALPGESKAFCCRLLKIQKVKQTEAETIEHRMEMRPFHIFAIEALPRGIMKE